MNGGLSLIPGAVIVAGHSIWSFPGVVLTGFGILLLIKSAVCLLAPDRALHSMAHGGSSPRSFVAGGFMLLIIGVWAWYCLWHGGVIGELGR